MPQFSCSDYILLFSISYTFFTIFIGSWNTSSCPLSLDSWLLFTISLMPFFKLSELLFLRYPLPDFRSQLFSGASNSYTITTLLLYLTQLVSTILGTFWYAEAKSVSSCLDEQVSWFISMWFIILYSWVVGYTSYISYSVIDYLQRTERERGYTILVDQYNGQEAPNLIHDPQGMTPLNISRITVSDYSSTEVILCSICLHPFSEGERIRITSCMHKFHLPCIDQWLLKKASCPNCKKEFNS